MDDPIAAFRADQAEAVRAVFSAITNKVFPPAGKYAETSGIGMAIAEIKRLQSLESGVTMQITKQELDDAVAAWDEGQRIEGINWALRAIEARQRAKVARLALIDAHVKLLRDEKEFHAMLEECEAIEEKARQAGHVA